MASERCWEVHKKCCITGTKGITASKPKDIVSMHIWQHAYQDEVCPLFSYVSRIDLPSVASNQNFNGQIFVFCIDSATIKPLADQE